MKASRARAALPRSVVAVLRKLGEDISAARRRRRISMQVMAARAFVGRNTLTRVERGDPGVSMGIYATVLFVLGMAERMGELADPRQDRLGIGLDEARLPLRIRSRAAAQASRRADGP